MQPCNSSLNFKYESTKELDLHPLVLAVIDSSKATEPNFPIELVRKMGEELGVEIN